MTIHVLPQYNTMLTSNKVSAYSVAKHAGGQRQEGRGLTLQRISGTISALFDAGGNFRVFFQLKGWIYTDAVQREKAKKSH
ncbi:MAG: hypothetical protein KAU50_05380 [Candidatus Marinimicrobia bacterium]|nr:hypothetical protein [Candidatus Neomarinimicrobiota bacterium]